MLFFVLTVVVLVALYVLQASNRATGLEIDLEVKWEPRDLWVGVFWDKRKDGTHIYVCPIPCVVFHFISRVWT